jgi:MFS transporter, DHA3 family, macrolide efflux protein
VVEFALAWYLTQKTGSATILATAMLVAMLPQIVLGPLIGTFIDRWNRRLIMIFSDLGIMVVTVGLAVLFLMDVIQVWHIYTAMVLRAIGQSFQFPAMQAAVATIVPEKDLARANGLNQTLQGIISIASPPLGAFLMEMLPMQSVLAVDIGTAVAAIGCMIVLVIPQPVRTTLSIKPSFITDMIQGFSYLWSKRGLTILLGLVAVLNFFGMPPFALLPMLVKQTLGGDVLKLGWLNMMFGVGMILGGVLLGIWGGFKKRVITSLAGIMFLGAATIGLGFTSERLYYFALVVNLLMGLGMAVANAPFMAIFNSAVSKDMQGRIFSLMGSITGLMMPLGLAFTGPTADAIGIRSIYFICGAAVLIITPLGLFSRQVMNIESQPPEKRPEKDGDIAP